MTEPVILGAMFNQHLRFLLLALAVAMFGGTAQADSYTDCFSGKLRQRIKPCTDVLNDPATNDFDRQRAYELRSADLQILGRFEESIQDLNKALELDPQSAAALNGRAWTLFKWKNVADGMDDVNASLRLDPGYAAAWDTRAHLYQLLGNFEKAFTEYEAAIGFGGEPFIRMYQCGLKERGLYKGGVDGIYSADMRAVMRACVFSKSCDPLPANEYEQDCEAGTS